MIGRLFTFVLGFSVSLLIIAFGSYLVYDRVYLALTAGQIEQRVGIVEQAVEPISFWIAVSMYGFFGCMITVFGIWCVVGSVRTR